jgi:hypothetical protein
VINSITTHMENNNSNKGKIIYLCISSEEQKKVIKKLGGRWDSRDKKWYILDNNENKERICDMFPVV